MSDQGHRSRPNYPTWDKLSAMAVQSQKTELGTALPATILPDLDGNSIELEQYRADGPLVVAFVANHCPYVKHVEGELGRLAAEASAAGVNFVAIVSNDLANYPDDDVPGARDQAQRSGWNFPYLMDREQTAAMAFGAACTPDFFVYAADGKLAYRGAMDESSPKNGKPLTGDALRDAIARVTRGDEVPLPHQPALGCGIKWLPGNQPEGINLI